MTSRSTSPGAILIALMILLCVYNLIYWTGKFFPGLITVITTLRSGLISNWGVLMFLEMLAVAALFVDLVVKWDDFTPSKLRWRFAVTVTLALAFVLRLTFGVMDMYGVGSVQ
jgi:hypothetical protein